MSKTKLRIHTWPEKILRKSAKPVEVFDQTIVDLFEEMLALMRVAQGAGLAGNQAGLDLQLIVVEAEGKIFKLANPRIVRREGAIKFCEGCLSFPGLEVDVTRSRKIWLTAFSETGQILDLAVDGVLSVIFQHEIDHINGITFVERISFWQKLKAYPKLKIIARGSNHELRKQKK